ncbi:MAG: peptide chain release factor 1 [Candidatus Saccharicenans sp.]|jgi:peptide chain release factor 1|nr:peptide chain release factor 1 [Candidatus Saccharicenans sp.]MDH7492999.1 peptide chain release factor 1 [Candidatus Saccharicenans sp.]
MLQELKALEDKYKQITALLSDTNISSNPQKIKELSRERSELEPLVRKYEDYKKVVRELRETESILTDGQSDPELRRLAESELSQLKEKKDRLEQELKKLLLPRNPNDEKNVILEIRAGAGGDEASLFAQDLLRMYTRYAEHKGWKWELMDVSYSPIGGIKEAIVNIQGKRVYSFLKYESGVHRVQRVPKTEASGRIHTSTATVAVLPEAEEIDLKLDPKDLKIEAFGASGPGGQNVNRNYTAIRVTHKPSGIVVSCQDEKSQHRNKEKALKILRTRLLDIARQEQLSQISRDRRKQVGSGERSEKIRTYNFPQSRLTDHRLNENFYNMENIMDGEMDDLIERLMVHFQARALEEEKSRLSPEEPVEI